VIEKEGFDPQTGLYLDFPEAAQWRSIPDSPTYDEVQRAIRLLWQPFMEFPFIEDADRGSFLAGLFTAATRPTYPTAPGLVVNATAPATGKSFLSFCLQLIAGGRIEAMAPGLRCLARRLGWHSIGVCIGIARDDLLPFCVTSQA
jgi:hypothetical protein